jgi:hypothetical protein
MISKNSAKITFFYLLSLFGLAFMAISSGMILFQVINKLIPDLIGTYSGRYSTDALRFAISAVIVATPVYYWMTSLIQKSLKSGELDKESQLRKWMTYIIIFISSVVIIVSLIGVINNYLSGDLTSKVALKLLITVLISGAVLSYYLYDIKRENFTEKKVIKLYFICSLIFVLFSLVLGFMFGESPAEVRKIKEDNNTINDLNSIRYRTEEYVSNYGSLPENLENLNKVNNLYLKEERDISEYEYKILNDTEYEICADFKTDNTDNNDLYYQREWLHKIGRECFKIKVNSSQGKLVPEMEYID